MEGLIQLNDALIKKPILVLFQSNLIEFYLTILNYLYFREVRITKFMYKVKFFAIVKWLTSNLKPLESPTISSSLLRSIQISFIRFKLNGSNLFCNQIIENSDIDLVVKRMAQSISPSQSSQLLKCSSVWLALIYTHIYKLEQVLKVNSSVKTEAVSVQPKSSDLGMHYEIRRLFDEALKTNSKSLHLWMLYLKFEFKYGNTEDAGFNQRILSIYYRSIKNLPYSKVIYTLAVRCLPDKYNELMGLLANKEIRVYLPIQELNILLEPIKNRNEIDLNEEESDSDSNMSISDNVDSIKNSNENTDESESETETEDEKEQQLSDILIDPKVFYHYFH